VRDTQRLAHDIIMANDARLIQQRLQSRDKQQEAPGLGSCDRAASAADLRAMAKSSSKGKSAPSSKVAEKLKRVYDSTAAQYGWLGSTVEVPFELMILEVLLDATTGKVLGLSHL
jgi:hypothetical protein